ncbi:MAG: hypothetical protein HOP22_10125 [Nitrospiraceae bacterium]|jgi:hypothetical protein|nr:hypothetical protein [Nitrospiraceae bacterium]
MGAGNADADEVVLNMVQRYEALMMEDLIIGRPDFSWAQMFLAIDRLSRKNLISLRRMGPTYQIRTINHAGTLGQTYQHEQRAVQHQ